MGLDSFIYVRDKNNESFRFEIAYFRKFYELDDFMRDHCESTIEDCLYKVSLDNLKALKEELLPIAQVLITIPERLLSKYDDYGYPKKYKLDKDELIHEDFNPIISKSSFAGYKTQKLYNVVCTLIELLEDNIYDGKLYIEYLSSW